MGQQALINIKNITFAYAQRPAVLEKLNFSLSPGQRAGLIGANGSGKTTMLHIIMGLIKAQAGTVEIFGQVRSGKRDFQQVRPQMGFVFQDANDQLFCPTVADDLAFGPLNLGFSQAETEVIVRDTLAMLGLEDFSGRVSYDLSGGEKKLVSIGTALALKPRLLILDEPTTGLDKETVERLEAILLKCGLPYLIVSHDRNFLSRVTDSHYILHGGRIEEL